MPKRVFKKEGVGNQLSLLLEGYLYGLGEVCHTLYGPRGEAAMYQAIGSYFLHYLEEKMHITFSESDPWERYCRIVETFTQYGFYSYVELEESANNKYWMLESGQFAGNVWEEQKAWQRGTPPCPLWSVILHSLAEIDYTVILDSVKFVEDSNGYESIFHFEKIPQREEEAIEKARKEIRSALLPICANCKKIRDDKDDWKDIEVYLRDNFEANFTHGICSDCMKKLYPDFYEQTGSEIHRDQSAYHEHDYEKGVTVAPMKASDDKSPLEKGGGSRGGKVLQMRIGGERRSGMERRSGKDRRSGVERRSSAA